jgi:hypothetical protein
MKKDERGTAHTAPLTVVVPENNSSYVAYYLPCDVQFNDIDEDALRVSNTELYSLFLAYREKMTASLAFSITYLDSDESEIHTQIIQRGARMLTIYRSFFFNAQQTLVGRPLEYWPIKHIFSFSPGYLGGTRQFLFLGSSNYNQKYGIGWDIELDENDLQKLDSMRFEYVFENR